MASDANKKHIFIYPENNAKLNTSFLDTIIADLLKLYQVIIKAVYFLEKLK